MSCSPPNIDLFTINRISALAPWGFQGFGGCPNKYTTFTIRANVGGASSSGGCRGPFFIQNSNNDSVSQRSISSMRVGKYGLWMQQGGYTAIVGGGKGHAQFFDDPETPQAEMECNSSYNQSHSLVSITPQNTECGRPPSSSNSHYSFSACTSCQPDPGCHNENREYLGIPMWVGQGLQVKSCTLMEGPGGESWSCQEPDWNNLENTPPCEAICGTYFQNISRSWQLSDHITASKVAALVRQELTIKANIAMINAAAGCDGNKGCAGDHNGCWNRWYNPQLPSFDVVSPYYNPGDENSGAGDSITLIKVAIDKAWFRNNQHIESIRGRVFFYYGGSGQRTPCCDQEDFDGVIVSAVPFEINREKEFIKHGFGGGEFYATENDLKLSMRNSELQSHINQTIKMCIDL